MTYVQNLFEKNFIEYASYVIKDRAIPYLEDGLKPVQRRIIHSLMEMDDGRFNKVANVVGHCMKYHPHGDASIYSALVVIANKDFFIEKQGNFGNIYTGDPASAARYIECRLLPLAREVLYNPEITEFIDSYDGRNKEPVTFPSKIPVVLIHGADGIAVGMSTKILPHNFNEVLGAVRSTLLGKTYELYPDFPTGGLVDVSEYADGNGKVLVRAKIEARDQKTITITEIPYGTTTESLIASVEKAAKKNKVKISSINDYSAEKVEIEVKLARGVHAKETVKALYAFTDCEQSISVNLLVIHNEKPVLMSITEIIDYFSGRVQQILKQELLLEQGHLNDKLHAKTLEQIFIEERIYKKIETMKTKNTVVSAVKKGFDPFQDQITREVTDDDVERLLKIPIRRISLYDINKAQAEIKDIKKRLREIKKHLKNIVDYAISFIDGILDTYGAEYIRKTKIGSFESVDVKEAAQRNLKVKYDEKTGYMGYDVSGGKLLFEASDYDKILTIKKSGIYTVSTPPDKMFVDKGLLYCELFDEKTSNDRIFTIVYRNDKNKMPYLKRCKIEKYLLNKAYELIPEGCTLLKMTMGTGEFVSLTYKPKPRMQVLQEDFAIDDYLVKGVKAQGVRLSNKEIKSVKIVQE